MNHSPLFNPLQPYRLILVNPMYAGNVGSVARISTNYDIADVHICQPKCAWKEGEALLYARNHSHDLLNQFKETDFLPSSLDGLTSAVGFSRRVGDHRQPNIETWQIAQLSARGRVGLVFGCEESGLSTEQLLHCTHICSLPTAPKMPSLNLSHAVAVVMSRIFESHLNGETGTEPSGSASDMNPAPKENALEPDDMIKPDLDFMLQPLKLENFEKLIEHFRSTMIASGLTIQGNPDRMLQDIRRIFQRAQLNNRETNIIRGILSAFERTLEKAQQ
jgi:tRNA (cytidine32/uridine32-2'-O)-methyltransferase